MSFHLLESVLRATIRLYFRIVLLILTETVTVVIRLARHIRREIRSRPSSDYVEHQPAIEEETTKNDPAIPALARNVRAAQLIMSTPNDNFYWKIDWAPFRNVFSSDDWIDQLDSIQLLKSKGQQERARAFDSPAPGHVRRSDFRLPPIAPPPARRPMLLDTLSPGDLYVVAPPVIAPGPSRFANLAPHPACNLRR